MIKKLISKEEIDKRLKEIGKTISFDYKDKEITIVVALKGAFITAANLSLNIDGNVKFLFTKVSSYGNLKESSGKVVMNYDIDQDLSGKDILIVEDIIDSGHTLKFLKEEYLKRNASSVKIFALLDKPSRRKVDIKPDYCGFEVEDKFIVGYGMDDDEKYRNLPYIGYIE
jgi:hypoxanthine phosphoribosyltransferase